MTSPNSATAPRGGACFTAALALAFPSTKVGTRSDPTGEAEIAGGAEPAGGAETATGPARKAALMRSMSSVPSVL